MDSTPQQFNAEQQRAIDHQDGPLLVLAGPGSGKTRVITGRIVRRIHDGVASERILALTFTNRAAQEMRTRVQELMGTEVPVAIGTFHWAGHAILRRHSHRLGIDRDFRLLSSGEARRVLRRALASAQHEYRLADVASALSACKNGAAIEEEARRVRVPLDRLRGFGEAYEREMRAIGALDLDDLLARTWQLLRDHPEVQELCREAHDEILVDEYQDTNPVQRQILQALVPPTGTVIAVGDEDQAIYGWRQADPSTVLRFAEDFPSATMVKLEETYRSTKLILRAAGALIEHNQARIGKTLRTGNAAGRQPVCFAAGDEIEEAEWIASEIVRDRSQRGRNWNDYAVLYRVNAQSRAIEDALLRQGIPYHVFSGYRFYDRPEIRRVVSYLRLTLNDADNEAALALLEEVPGIGPRRLASLLEEAGTGSLMDLLSRAPASLPAPTAVRVRTLSATVQHLRAGRTASLARVVDAAIAIVAAGLEDVAPIEREAALENLDELRSVVVEMSGTRGTLRGFLERFALAGGADDHGEGVRLLSLHAAKGLEFPVVFLAGLEEGLLPHRRSLQRDSDIEEERRLCYVGMTRAREILNMSYAHARLLGGQFQVGQGSRFLGEMGAANMTLRISDKVASRPRLAFVQVGERVMHPRWRCGTVEKVEGHGRATTVTIAFDTGMRQRIQLCHAPLSRTGEENGRVLAG